MITEPLASCDSKRVIPPVVAQTPSPTSVTRGLSEAPATAEDNLKQRERTELRINYADLLLNVLGLFWAGF